MVRKIADCKSACVPLHTGWREDSCLAFLMFCQTLCGFLVGMYPSNSPKHQAPPRPNSSAGVPPECGIAAEKLPQADPAPYGMARLELMASCHRTHGRADHSTLLPGRGTSRNWNCVGKSKTQVHTNISIPHFHSFWQMDHATLGRWCPSIPLGLKLHSAGVPTTEQMQLSSFMWWYGASIILGSDSIQHVLGKCLICEITGADLPQLKVLECQANACWLLLATECKLHRFLGISITMLKLTRPYLYSTLSHFQQVHLVECSPTMFFFQRTPLDHLDLNPSCDCQVLARAEVYQLSYGPGAAVLAVLPFLHKEKRYHLNFNSFQTSGCWSQKRFDIARSFKLSNMHEESWRIMKKSWRYTSNTYQITFS